MKRFLQLVLGLALASVHAAEAGFVPLFNDHDFTGWVNVNGAPDTWTNRGGLIVCTGKPISMLRTEDQYENFILEAEWRHLTSAGNSGIFVWATPIPAPGVPFLRGIEVQILDNGQNKEGKNVRYTTHGDIFPTHGSTMTPVGRTNGKRGFPSEERSKSSPEWNHYRVVCRNGTVRLSVNGKEVSGGNDCVYRKGYLALESEGAPVEFRNVRIKELPPTGVSPEASAPLDLKWKSLFTGLDLTGWQKAGGGSKTWEVVNEKITHLPNAGGDGPPLLTHQEFGDVQLIVDVKAGETAESPAMVVLRARDGGDGFSVPVKTLTPQGFQRFTITVRGRDVTVESSDREPTRFALPNSIAARGRIGFQAGSGAIEIMNVFVRNL